MLEDPKYLFGLIRECAEKPPGPSLSVRPYLRKALVMYHGKIEGDMPGTVLKALCEGIVERRELAMGEDD